MIDKLVKLGVSLPPFILVVGIVSARLTGSSHAVEFSPIISVIRGTIATVIKGASEHQLEGSEGRDEPITELGKKAIDNLSQANNPLANIPLDPRLAICPKGSIAHENIVPFTLADKYRQASPQPKDLIEVQGKLGEPNCIEARGKFKVYRYLVSNGRFITASQEGDKSKVLLEWGNW